MSFGGAIFVSLNGSNGECIDRLLVKLVKVNHDEGVKESLRCDLAENSKMDTKQGDGRIVAQSSVEAGTMP